MKIKTTILIAFFWIIIPFNLAAQNTEWNLSFEEWDFEDQTPGLWNDTSVIENRVGLFPPKWHFRSDYIPERMGLGRTTDATEGEYAVTMSGYYSYEVMRIISGNDEIHSGWPINFKPNKLSGDYKAILLGECDSLRTYVDIYLTRHDGNKRDTIGQANAVLKESDSYTPFELKINYTNEVLTPDTVIVVLAKRRFGFDVPPACLECSHVFFDNLRLRTAVTNLGTDSELTGVEFYPNPTKDRLIIKSECRTCLFDVAMFSANGQLIKRYNSILAESPIETEYLSAGIYFMRIEDSETKKFVYKKLIKE